MREELAGVWGFKPQADRCPPRRPGPRGPGRRAKLTVVHYCQSCDEATPMNRAAGLAVCPACGRREPAPTAPLLVVTGASGSGKTTLLSPLAQELAGEAAVFDIDVLIDPFGMQAGEGELDWTAIRAAWLSVAAALAHAGLPTVLLGPLAPFHFDAVPQTRWVGPIHYLLLDCPDLVRGQRLEARPPWRKREIQEQTRWAGWLREHVADRVDTSELTVEETVRSVATWVRAVVDRPPSGQRHQEG